MKTLVPCTLILLAASLSPCASTWALDDLAAREGDVAAAVAPATGPLLETEAGQAALEAAGDAKRAAYALAGTEREERLLVVAETYGSVADDAAFGLRERVEACFRAGEILRAREQLEQAARRFEQADRFGRASTDDLVRSFGSRGLLELGHAQRRAGAMAAALERYAEVQTSYPEQLRSRTHAISWSGKLLIKEGRLDEARDLLMQVAPFLPDHALEAVKNVDGLVDALQEAGRAEEGVELVLRLERDLNAGSSPGAPAPEVGSALAALRDKVGASGY